MHQRGLEQMTTSFSPDSDAYKPGIISRLLADRRVQRAFDFIDLSQSEFTDELIKICEIPAPPFKERERGRYMASRFEELGLSDVGTDEAGNITGIYPGERQDYLLVISAHLDTVFPEGTDVKVRKAGSRLHAPGIADDSAGLAALIGLIQALNAAEIKLNGSIAFIATVGEEGEGDLRGVRHLFTDSKLRDNISAFISFDGPGVEYITHQALGSKRYRIRLTGPGGHSWGDFGVVNPVHAMGRAIAQLASYSAPSDPRTTYNVGRIEGGESVNVIPLTACMDVDLRSTSPDELSRMEEFLLGAVNQAVAEENSIRSSHPKRLDVNITLIGDRPSGETPPDAALVRTTIEASRALGISPILNCASTDSNIPISLGIQSITIGVGGLCEDSHRLTEWYDPEGRELGYKRALLVALGMTDMADTVKGDL